MLNRVASGIGPELLKKTCQNACVWLTYSVCAYGATEIWVRTFCKVGERFERDDCPPWHRNLLQITLLAIAFFPSSQWLGKFAFEATDKEALVYGALTIVVFSIYSSVFGSCRGLSVDADRCIRGEISLSEEVVDKMEANDSEELYSAISNDKGCSDQRGGRDDLEPWFDSAFTCIYFYKQFEGEELVEGEELDETTVLAKFWSHRSSGGVRDLFPKNWSGCACYAEASEGNHKIERVPDLTSSTS